MTAGLADPTPDDAEYTVQGKANAKELVAVHNHRREELSRYDLIGPLARFGFRR